MTAGPLTSPETQFTLYRDMLRQTRIDSTPGELPLGRVTGFQPTVPVETQTSRAMTNIDPQSVVDMTVTVRGINEQIESLGTTSRQAASALSRFARQISDDIDVRLFDELLDGPAPPALPYMGHHARAVADTVAHIRQGNRSNLRSMPRVSDTLRAPSNGPQPQSLQPGAPVKGRRPLVIDEAGDE